MKPRHTGLCGKRFTAIRITGGCLFFAGLLLVSGCLVGPNYQRPEAPVVEIWREADTKAFVATSDENHRWWASFKDPILDTLVERAYKQNLDLRSAAFRVLAARARAGIARGEFWPQVQDARGELGRVNTSERKCQPGTGG
jgi:outer membrane protein TolC